MECLNLVCEHGFGENRWSYRIQLAPRNILGARRFHAAIATCTGNVTRVKLGQCMGVVHVILHKEMESQTRTSWSAAWAWRPVDPYSICWWFDVVGHFFAEALIPELAPSSLLLATESNKYFSNFSYGQFCVCWHIWQNGAGHSCGIHAYILGSKFARQFPARGEEEVAHQSEVVWKHETYTPELTGISIAVQVVRCEGVSSCVFWTCNFAADVNSYQTT